MYLCSWPNPSLNHLPNPITTRVAIEGKNLRLNVNRHWTFPPERQLELEARFLMMEFHISRDARLRYKFVESLFSFSGNAVFANLAGAREFAHRMNLVRDVEKHPERAVHAGQLYAMGLIDDEASTDPPRGKS